MTSLTTRGRKWRLVLPAILAAALVAGTAACSSPKAQAGAAGGGTIVIWTDSTRKAAFDAFATANPTVKVKIEVVDPAALLSKIQLANRAGKGWPDVVFDSTPSDVASLSSPLFKYAQPLDTLVPKDVQDQFATHNAWCTLDGHLYCLQNDLAQDVLWVNQPLMDKFGYKVPTTFDEYQQLGAKVAAEHPGYVLGAAGDADMWYDFLWSSGCPLATAKSSTEVQINTADVKCTRVADILDPMLKNGSLSRLSPFDPTFVKLAQSDKLLMQVGPSWMGEYVLHAKASYNLPDGKIAVAPMPTWPGETTNYSGAWGGGIYLVSSHAANKAGAAAVAQWVSTNNAYQATAPTFPAYIPAAEAWAQTMAGSKFYVTNPVPVLTAAAGKINPAVAPVRYPVDLGSTVVAAVKSGATIASGFAGLQAQLSGLAQTAGYAVTN